MPSRTLLAGWPCVSAYWTEPGQGSADEPQRRMTRRHPKGILTDITLCGSCMQSQVWICTKLEMRLE